MKPLNVLHVLNEIKPSGAEMMLLTALPRFKASGANLFLLATGEDKGIVAPRFEAAGCEVLHLPFAYSVGYFYRVWQLFRQKRWDVIHLHTERANFYLGMVALATRKPVLRTIHNVFSFDGWLRFRRGLQRRILEMFGLRHVAIGASVLGNERSRFGIRPALVPNWYDDVKFQPASPAQRQHARSTLRIESDRRFVIVSVGNCSDVKNHKNLLRAMALLPAAERPLYLHAGIEDSQASERSLAVELGLDTQSEVRFLGAVSDVPALLHAADAFVMPSLFEGMSIASIEALGSGLQAVLSDVPGLRDLRDEFPGIIYCEPIPESIASALTLAMQQPAEVRERAASGQAVLARERFGVEQGVQGYVRLYRSAD